MGLFRWIGFAVIPFGDAWKCLAEFAAEAVHFLLSGEENQNPSVGQLPMDFTNFAISLVDVIVKRRPFIEMNRHRKLPGFHLKSKFCNKLFIQLFIRLRVSPE